MKVLLLSKYSRMGGSSRLRSLQYIPFLESQGVAVNHQPLFDDSYLDILYRTGRRPVFQTLVQYFKRICLLTKVSKFDLIWIEKEIFPYLPAFAERLLSFFCVPYIVDYDDAIFHNYDASSSSLVRFLLGGKIDVVMRKSDYVIAGNSYLADRARSVGAKKIRVIPTAVDRTRYLQRNNCKNSGLTIGWIGSPSTQKYLLGIRDVLCDVCSKFDVRLKLIGASSDFAEMFSGVDVEIVTWTEDTEVSEIAVIDIGIMPLPDEPWERGKCGYKIIQYMASGVPVVASPVGVNRVIVESANCGFLAASEEDWYRYLVFLLESDNARLGYGKAGEEMVGSIYSLDVQAPILCNILMGKDVG